MEEDLINHSQRKGKMWSALLKSVALEFKEEESIYTNPDSVKLLKLGLIIFQKLD